LFQVSGLSKRFGAHSVLEGVGFVLNRSDRVGLVGPNGSGKSTLLRCITGAEQADAGTVSVEPGVRVGWLPQVLEAAPGTTLLEYASGGASALEHEVLRAADRLAAGESEDGYASSLEAFDAAGGYARLARADEILSRLGLGEIRPETSVDELSGGQKTRLMLAGVLLDQPDVLLLDEPTNHLDVSGLEWLASFLRGYAGAVLIASHDRAFLDDVAEAILYLDPGTRTLRRYPGNYSAFRAAREAEHEQQAARWQEQQQYVSRVKSDISRLKGEALAIEKSTTPRQPGLRVYARRKAAVAKAREKKLDRYLESEDRVEKPRQGWGLKLDLAVNAGAGREAFRLRDVSAGYGGTEVLRQVSLDIQHGDRVAVTGPNGSGKTTLLRLLARELAPTTGEAWRSPNVQLAFLRQEQENLDPELSVLETVRPARAWDETAIRNFLHLFLFAGDGALQRVGDCSPGERSRLQLALAIARGANVLLLDEPMNHLDIEGREHFEEALDAFSGAVVVVSHDRRFVERFARRVVAMEEGRATVSESAAREASARGS
jgi:ATPase subunit of ABC transporter with duplicated ATPase domains